MTVHPITYRFYDFEIESIDIPNDIHLVKILSVDGRRFTYEVRGPLTDETVAYIKGLLDAVVFSDIVIERTDEGYEAHEAMRTLKKHS